MKLTMPRGATLLLVLALTAVVMGCAKKAQETPPTPPPTPPQPTVTPVTTPTETPPTPVPPPRLSSSDFRPAFFDLDSYTLRDDAREALDHDARLLRENADSRVTLEGHCDERGTVEYNQALGERRANAARDYLVAAGIDVGRLTSISYGKERPFDSGHDEAAWAKNRRAHVVLR